MQGFTFRLGVSKVKKKSNGSGEGHGVLKKRRVRLLTCGFHNPLEDNDNLELLAHQGALGQVKKGALRVNFVTNSERGHEEELVCTCPEADIQLTLVQRQELALRCLTRLDGGETAVDRDREVHRESNQKVEKKKRQENDHAVFRRSAQVFCPLLWSKCIMTVKIPHYKCNIFVKWPCDKLSTFTISPLHLCAKNSKKKIRKITWINK